MASEKLNSLINAVADGRDAYLKANEDGTINIMDLQYFVPILLKIPEVIQDGPAAWEEIKNANYPDRQESVELVKKRFNLSNDSAENLIQKMLDTLISSAQTVIAIKDTFIDSPDAPAVQ